MAWTYERGNDVGPDDEHYSKLKYYTTAAWLRGYASSFDEENENAKSIVYHLMMASQLLDAVWDEYAKEAGYTNAAD